MTKLDPLVSTILNAIENKYVVGYVYKEDISTDILIEYFPESEMRVSGLKPEFPPYIRFKDEEILFSKDNQEWNKVPKESGYEVLKLFDPRIVLKNTIIEEKDDKSFSGICSVLAVTGSASLDKYFSDVDLRKVSFKYNNNALTEMRRKDFPPSNDIVRLVFTYPKSQLEPYHSRIISTNLPLNLSFPK